MLHTAGVMKLDNMGNVVDPGSPMKQGQLQFVVKKEGKLGSVEVSSKMYCLLSK